MKTKFLRLQVSLLLLGFCFIVNAGTPLYKVLPTNPTPFITLPQPDSPFAFPFKNKKTVLGDEELIQKMKDALYLIYDEKKMTFNEFNVDKSGNEITLTGSGELYKEDITITSIFTTGGNILSFSGKFKPNTEVNNRNFKKITAGEDAGDWFPKTIQRNIVVDNISIAFDENSHQPTELSLTIGSAKDWEIIENGALRMNNITGTLTVNNPAGKTSATASLSGDFKIGPSTIVATATLGSMKEDWTFGGELSNLSITQVIKSVVGSIDGLPMPDGFVDVSIVQSSFAIVPAANTFSVKGSGAVAGYELGALQMKIAPKDGRSKDLSFMVGVEPSPSFKMANIEPSLKMIDDLGITNFGLVLSSDAAASADLDVFKRLGENSKIGRGLNYIGAYDLKAVNLDKLIGLNTIMVRAVVSNRLSDLLLEASINTNIAIGSTATFKRIIFKIKPSPANFQISMGGDMEVKIDKDVLVFNATMGVDITDQALFVEGSMTGMWNEPFGAKGLSIGDLWMKFGVSFRTTPIPLPELGIAGKLKANDFEGDLMVVINTNNPTESALDAGFNKIDLKAILETYCSKQTLNNIPSEIRNTVLDVSMEDVRLTVVPRPMTINNTSYDAGFRAKGTAKIGEMGAMLDVTIGYDGIDARAEVESINYPPFFELKGARGAKNPSIHIVAKASTESKVAISGSATVLGLTSETDMLLNDKGFDLYMKGKIFDAFQASLEVSGSRVTDGGSFRVAATFEQNFLEYFTKHASEEIDKATRQTQRDIKIAKDKITDAQREVAKLEGEITNQKRIVQAERNRDLANFRAAQAEVEKARAEVRKVQNDINNAHNAIAVAKANIKRKEDWVNAEGAFIAIGRGTAALPYFTEQSAIISYQAGVIATLETAKATAEGTLYLTQKSLEGMHYIGENMPLEADPRVGGLIASKDIAIGTMEAAKAIVQFGGDVGVGTLQGAKWIVENGVTGVVNITYAHFEGQLSAANGGSVTLHVKGTFAGDPLDKKVTFNFNNPFDEVVKFADNLL